MTASVPLGRYLRTTAGLRPVQLGARVRLRGQRAVLSRHPGLGEMLLRGRPPAESWPIGFLPFDGRCPPARPMFDEIVAGRLTLLGHSRDLCPRDSNTPATGTPVPPTPTTGTPAGAGAAAAPARWDWRQADAPLLWRYHLHYWDWAWAFTTEAVQGPAMFARLYLAWRTSVALGDPVAWSPYVVSLRAWTLCALWPRLARGTPAEMAVLADLGVCRSFLRTHLETDVGGNHLLKNYKALIGLAVADDDARGRRRWVDALLRELDRQVLSDGGHYERSPTYHCQVLADLDDVAGLLTAAGHVVSGALLDAAGRMRAWLTAVLGPDGVVPTLNDGFAVPAEALRLLLPAPVRPTPIAVQGPGPVPIPAPRLAEMPTSTSQSTVGTVPRPRTPASDRADALLLVDSGLAVLTAGPWHLLADVGLPCPEELPAHAHADTLAFLLWHDGRPLLVDTGTSTYAPGPDRDAERGTAAHSTVIVDHADSTEVWGAFRAGRRARPTLVTMCHHENVATLAAGHDGYRHLPGRPVHWRTWRLDPSGLSVDDRITGEGRHHVEVLFHFAPGVSVTAAAADTRRTSTTSIGTTSIGTSRNAATRSGATDALTVTTSQGRLVLRAGGPGRWVVRSTRRAVGWSRTVPAYTAAYVIDAELPVAVRTTVVHEVRSGGPRSGNLRSGDTESSPARL
ncbi:heparinase II/III family protein [Frankia sp. BMG5.23]|uniref:heparinase II/III family protein n=1 Tax=Frankia sp. BMG5.23 TaxID=683305 RepID=UPI000461DFBB|nr:heparinase II/III family protein [Frankia sp. BMG5.23]KDA43553.1 hypothetical protein BMG523Draft_01672 [Frankia sp. BMG5.23]